MESVQSIPFSSWSSEHFPSQERPVSISQFGDGFEPEELSWTSQPEFNRVSLFSSEPPRQQLHQVLKVTFTSGREKRQRKRGPEERLLKVSERKGWLWHACLCACVHACDNFTGTVLQKQQVRHRWRQNKPEYTVKGGMRWNRTIHWEATRCQIESAWKIVQRLQASRPRPRDMTAKEPLWSQPKQHSWSTALFFHL